MKVIIITIFSNLYLKTKYKYLILLNLFSFIFGIFKLILFIKPLDKKLPFKGLISKNNGYCKLSINKETAELTKRLFKKRFFEKPLDLDSLHINKVIEEIFDKIANPVKDYLGNNCYIDGIYFSIINFENPPKQISGNWHTDNVGTRLKVFVCLEGDGMLPTYIIPNKNRIPTLRDFMKIFNQEIGRYFPKGNKKNLNRAIPLKHSTGSIYIFDTQLIHRGAYEELANRLILIIEFSPINKHKFFSNKSLGTNRYNCFKFDKSLLKIDNFSDFIDSERVYEYENKLIYQNKNTILN